MPGRSSLQGARIHLSPERDSPLRKFYGFAIIPDIGSINEIRIDLVKHAPFSNMGLETHPLRLDLWDFN